VQGGVGVGERGCNCERESECRGEWAEGRLGVTERGCTSVRVIEKKPVTRGIIKAAMRMWCNGEL
jgi:hypothetical protein